MTISNLFKIKFLEKRKIADIAKMGFYEYEFEMEKAHRRGKLDQHSQLIELEQILLLPASIEESFIPIGEASKKSGLSISDLKNLCKGGELTGITIGTKWYILDMSLEAYLRDLEEC